MSFDIEAVVVKPNLSFTTTSSFVGKVNIKDRPDIDELITYIQEFETPSFTKGYATKKKGNDEIFLKGENKTKTPITVNFIIDDEFFVYTRLLDLFNDSIDLDNLQLFLLNGDDIAVVAITYHDASISNIGSIQFNTTDEGAIEVKVPVEFIYGKFTYERLK